MHDREKVIKGLECCSAMSGDECRRCPYSSECLDVNLQVGMSHLAGDALELLKTMEVVVRCKDCIYCIPYNDRWRLPIVPDGLWCRYYDKQVKKEWYCHESQGW